MEFPTTKIIIYSLISLTIAFGVYWLISNRDVINVIGIGEKSSGSFGGTTLPKDKPKLAEVVPGGV